MREFATAAELLDAVREEGVLVYGTGFVARSLLAALDAHGLSERVEGFVVSSPQEPGATHVGLPLVGVDALAADEPRLICVAVHESVLPEIAAALEERGIGNATWIYPHLQRLIYGEPLRRGQRVRVADILAAQDPRYRWIAVRALAAMEHAGTSKHGYDVYLKAQSLHCSPATARMRLERFKTLMESVAARGIDSRYPLLCDENLQVIDGLHRLSLCWLEGVCEVSCDIVAASESYGRLIDDRNRLTPAVLDDAGLTAEERAELEGVQARLWESCTDRG